MKLSHILFSRAALQGCGEELFVKVKLAWNNYFYSRVHLKLVMNRSLVLKTTLHMSTPWGKTTAWKQNHNLINLTEEEAIITEEDTRYHRGGHRVNSGRDKEESVAIVEDHTIIKESVQRKESDAIHVERTIILVACVDQNQ